MIHPPLAPCAVRAAQTARISRAVLPPSSGGLHCRFSTSPSPAPSLVVLPPSSGGLHCGDDKGNPAVKYWAVLPPSSGGLHCGAVTGTPSTGSYLCSRRPAAGSIAASRSTGSAASLGPCAPPFGGLHCGAEQIVQTEALRLRTPAVGGGLHCGLIARHMA